MVGALFWHLSIHDRVSCTFYGFLRSLFVLFSYRATARKPRFDMKGFSKRPAQALLAVLGLSISPMVAALAGDWTITPRVSGQEILTDNVLGTPINRRSDFITNL